MGIHGLIKLIDTEVGKYAIKEYPISKFANMTIAVDASLMVYQTVVAIRATGQDLKNANGEITSHLYGIFYKILKFLDNKITPIFVFDGKAPDIKNDTIKRRSERKTKAKELIKNIDDEESEQYIKYFKQIFTPTAREYKSLQTMLDLLGIPYIIAPGEADPVCAWLTIRKNPDTGKKYAKGVCSDDSDMLTLGAKYLFKDMLKFIGKTKNITVVNLDKTLVGLNLTYEQFIDLSVLMGCDYCENIKDIGAIRSLKLINSHKNLENVIKFLIKHDKLKLKNSEIGTKEIENCMLEAKKYFKNVVKNLDKSPDFNLSDKNIYLRKYQYKEFMDFMCYVNGFDANKIKVAMVKLEKYYESLNVTRENTTKYKMKGGNNSAHIPIEDLNITFDDNI